MAANIAAAAAQTYSRGLFKNHTLGVSYVG